MASNASRRSLDLFQFGIIALTRGRYSPSLALFSISFQTFCFLENPERLLGRLAPGKRLSPLLAGASQFLSPVVIAHYGDYGPRYIIDLQGVEIYRSIPPDPAPPRSTFNIKGMAEGSGGAEDQELQIAAQQPVRFSNRLDEPEIIPPGVNRARCKEEAFAQTVFL